MFLEFWMLCVLVILYIAMGFVMYRQGLIRGINLGIISVYRTLIENKIITIDPQTRIIKPVVPENVQKDSQ